MTTRKLQVQHLPSDYPKATECEEPCDLCEMIAEQEQDYGEERVEANEN